QYPLDNIYNIDKTGFFYRMQPNQTLSSKPILGQKKDKTKITIPFGVNAMGTNKLVPWVIGKSPCPRAFEVLKHINNEFRAKNKKVLLLVDNAPSHFDPNNCLQDTEIEQNNNIDVTDTNIIKEVVEINEDDEYDEYNSYGEESSISARS
ncbi:17400_t:CDS:2, partial [Dentiscutata heterogama]